MRFLCQRQSTRRLVPGGAAAGLAGATVMSAVFEVWFVSQRVSEREGIALGK